MKVISEMPRCHTDASISLERVFHMLRAVSESRITEADDGPGPRSECPINFVNLNHNRTNFGV